MITETAELTETEQVYGHGFIEIYHILLSLNFSELIYKTMAVCEFDKSNLDGAFAKLKAMEPPARFETAHNLLRQTLVAYETILVRYMDWLRSSSVIERPYVMAGQLFGQAITEFQTVIGLVPDSESEGSAID